MYLRKKGIFLFVCLYFYWNFGMLPIINSPSEEAIPFLEYDDAIFDFDFPEEVVKYKEIILPLKGDSEFKELISEDLNTSYKNTDISKLSIHVSSIRVTQACAVYVNTEWHRAIIQGKMKNEQIIVNLIDKNCIKIVERENIKYLMDMFK